MVINNDDWAVAAATVVLIVTAVVDAILSKGLVGRSVECVFCFPYHQGLFQKFKVKTQQRYITHLISTDL